jgi:hypothetical protein
MVYQQTPREARFRTTRCPAHVDLLFASKINISQSPVPAFIGTILKGYPQKRYSNSHRQKGRVGLRHMPAKGVEISDGGCPLKRAFGKLKVHRCSTDVTGPLPPLG